MSLGKHSIKSFARLHGFWIHKRILGQTPYWGPERRVRYVLDHLRRTLIHAWEGTSYYRRLFDELGFNPKTDLREPSDISALPLLRKDRIREHFEALIDHRYLAGSFTAETSGTTGEPLRMRLSESHAAFDSACIFRHWSWAGYRFHAPVAALRSYVPSSENDPLWRFSRAQNTMFFSAYHLTPKNCGQYLDQILKFKPEFIRGYPSSIAVLAECARSAREEFEFVKGIFTSSETLLPNEREIIEGAFGKKLFNWYGMTEPAAVLTECEAHEGMHLNWEYGYTELLAGEDLGPDEFRLCTTSFHNPVMPFIRYDTGDIVRTFEHSRSCSCGRNLPLVQSVSGRKDECLIMQDGRRLPSINFYTVFRKYNEVVKFQIVQYGRVDIVVKVALRPQTTESDALIKKLTKELRARFGRDVSLTVECTDRFLTNSDGKTSPIVRRPGARSIEEKSEYVICSQQAWEIERQGGQVWKLDWNEADRLVSPKVQEKLIQQIQNSRSIYWYPEANSQMLLHAISDYAGVPKEHVLPTHGSDDAMELVATCFVQPNDRVLMLWPNYDNFRAVVEQRGAEVIKFDYLGAQSFPLQEFEEAVRKHVPRIVYLSNPNNPVGYALSQETLAAIHGHCIRHSSILVVDEAYYEFCGITASIFLPRSSQLLLTRSFSKAFGLAGMRLGYVLASGDILRPLRHAHNPKTVTTLAAAAAITALADISSMRGYVQEVRQSRERICGLLSQNQVSYFPSQANFVLFQHDRARELIHHLEKRNIFVRDRSSYFGGRGHIRLSVGGRESTEAMLEALKEYFQQQPESRAAPAVQISESEQPSPVRN